MTSSLSAALSNLTNTLNKNKTKQTAPTSKTSLATSTPSSLNQTGLDNLNNISSDFSSLDSAVENIETLFEKYKLVLDELNSTSEVYNSNNYDEENDEEEKQQKYKYAQIPFLPYSYYKPVFKSHIENLKLCPKVKKELQTCNEILLTNIKETELFYKNLSNLASTTSESFGYSTSLFAQSLVPTDAGIDEKYGILFFYLANLAKNGKITAKTWKDCKQSNQFNSLNLLPSDIQKVYSTYSHANLIQFANKYCNFLSDEYLNKKSKILISFLRNLEKIEFFLDHGSLDDFESDFNYEDVLLKSLGGPDIHDYFLDFTLDLGRAGKMPSYVAKALRNKRNTTKNDDTESDNDSTSYISTKKLKKDNLIDMCISKKIDINYEFLKKFFEPFGNVLEDNSKIKTEYESISKVLNINKTFHSLRDFENSIDTWNLFYTGLKAYFKKSVFSDIFDKIYKCLVNNVWFCGQSIDKGQFSFDHLKFPYLISIRDCSILLNIQESDISTLPSTIFMDDFCLSPISIMLVLLAIGHYQEKNSISEEERYFLDQLSGNGNPVLTNLILIKLFDYVLFLANNSLNINATKYFANYYVENRQSFDEIIPFVFSSVKMVESAKIDLSHRGAFIDNENNIHVNSMWTLNFVYNFAINSTPLSSFMDENNLNRNLKEVVRIMYSKIDKLENFDSAKGSNKKTKVLINSNSIVDLCLKIHSIDLDKVYVYEYEKVEKDIKNEFDIQNITFVTRNQIDSVQNLKDRFLIENFFKSSNLKIENNDFKKIIISKHQLDKTIKPINLVSSYCVSKIFIINKNKTNLKIAQNKNNLYILNKNVNLQFLLNLKDLLTAEFKSFNFFIPSSRRYANVIPVNYVDCEIVKNHVDEYYDENLDEYSKKTVVFQQSNEPIDLENFFKIEPSSKLYKENKHKNYKYYFDNSENFEFFANEIENVENRNIKPNFPEQKHNLSQAGYRKKRSKRKLKQNLNTKALLIEENKNDEKLDEDIDVLNKDSNINLDTLDKTNNDENIMSFVKNSDFDNSFLLNITNNNLEKLRLLIIKIERLFMESCKHLKLNSKIKLLEYTSLMHFKKYPFMYIMCPEFKELVPYYHYFKDVYVNNFTVNLNELEKALSITHNTSDFLQKFKEHYFFLIKRSLPLKKFGILIKQDKISSNLHIMALYIIHSQLKLVGDKSYDDFKV